MCDRSYSHQDPERKKGSLLPIYQRRKKSRRIDLSSRPTTPATPIKAPARTGGAGTGRRGTGGHGGQFGHAESDLAHATKEVPHGGAHFVAEFFLEEAHGQWVEGLDVFVEGVAGKVGVSLQHVNHHGPPGHDVALLGLVVQQGEGADDVGTETGDWLAGSTNGKGF